jgi:hypothetical protein
MTSLTILGNNQYDGHFIFVILQPRALQQVHITFLLALASTLKYKKQSVLRLIQRIRWPKEDMHFFLNFHHGGNSGKKMN